MQPIENLKDLRFYEILICSFDYFNKISFNSCLSFSVPNKAMSLNAAYCKKGNKLCKQNHQQNYVGIYKQLYSRNGLYFSNKNPFITEHID